MTPNIIEHQPTQAPAAISSPAKLLEIAVSKDMDIEKLERLLALQERWDSEQARKAYLDSFSKFQAECPEIPKNIKKVIPYKQGGGSKTLEYADLGQISKYVRPAMEKHGLSFRWEQNQADGLIKITCIMSHRDGHSEKTSLFSQPDTSGGKGGLHSIMSTVTYLKRYTLSCLAGLSTVDSDDDGVAGDRNRSAGNVQIVCRAIHHLLEELEFVLEGGCARHRPREFSLHLFKLALDLGKASLGAFRRAGQGVIERL